MKVIKDNLNKTEQWPKKIECDYCGSELEVEKDDVAIGALGSPFCECPVCGKKYYFDEDIGIEMVVTKDNIKFPDHFFHSVDGKDLNSDDIKKYINDGINFFRKHPEAFTYVSGSGNTCVIIQNYSGDNDYYVVVTKDYYDTYINYKDADYYAQASAKEEWYNIGVESFPKEDITYAGGKKRRYRDD